jgi:hypothetical protein
VACPSPALAIVLRISRAREYLPVVEAHAVDHADFVAVLQVSSHARQRDPRLDTVFAQVIGGPIQDSISNWGVLKAPPARITSRAARASQRNPASSLGRL